MPTLYYVHDPMCSWCWAFRPTLLKLQEALPAGIEFKQLLGGLAQDTDQPMDPAMQQQLQETWRRIQKKLPETQFNFDFWHKTQPRRATYPACRAVIAARRLDPAAENPMILAIQQAYYLQARNPSDDAVLIQLASEIGLPEERFAELLQEPQTQSLLEEEFEQARRLGAHSFPSLVLQQGMGYWPIPVDYHSVDNILETLAMVLD
jgi:putative protein-disulfide isomerase